MWNRGVAYQLRLGVLAALAWTAASQANARDLNAGFVVETMSALEQYAYVAGIVEGLVTLHPNTGEVAAASCIYAWFYDDTDSMKNTLAAFAYFPERRPGEVLHAMIAQRCPP